MDYTIKVINGKQFKVYSNGRRSPHGGDRAFIEQTGLSAAEMIRNSAKAEQEKPAPKSAAPEVDVTEDKENSNE